MSEYIYTLDGKDYSVWVLNGDQAPNEKVPENHPEYPIRKGGIELQVREYERVGYPLYASIENMLLASRSMVAISELHDPSKILHMISVYKDDPLPGIKMMRANGAEVSIHSPPVIDTAESFGLNPEGPTSQSFRKGDSHTRVTLQPRALMGRLPHKRELVPHRVGIGGAVEIGAFARSQDSARGFFPLLLHLLNAHELLIHSGRAIPESLLQKANMPDPDHETRYYSHGTRLANQELYNRHVIGVTFSEGIVNYLSEMGFDVWKTAHEGDSEKPKLTLLGMEIKDFNEYTYKKFSLRKDGDSVKRGHLKLVNSAPAFDWSKKTADPKPIIPQEKLSTPPAVDPCALVIKNINPPPLTDFQRRFPTPETFENYWKQFQQ